MQLDPAPRLRQPFPHDLGVMITRVVQKNMDQREQRIERFDRLQQLDRRNCVDGFDFDHPGLSGLEIDGAVNVDALTPARLLNRELVLFGRPAADRPRRMGRMHRVGEQHGLVGTQGIHQVFIARNESALLLFVELARDDVRLVIFKTQPMQQRDQSRAAFVNETVFLFDPGADVARRTRQCRADKNFQCLFLRGAQKACASAHVEAGQTFNPALLEQLAPVADRVVVKKQRSGHSLAAPPVIEQHNRVGPPRHTRGRRPVARQPDQSCPILFAKEAASNHSPIRIPSATKRKEILPNSQ